MTPSISFRFIALIAACVMLIVGISGLIDYRLTKAEILERVDLETEQHIRSAITGLEGLLVDMESFTSFFGHIVSRGSHNREELRALLQDVLQDNDKIFGSAIALAQDYAPEGYAPYYHHSQGSLKYRDLSATVGDYWSTEWFASAAKNGAATWVEPYLDKGGAEVLMTTYAHPVYRSDAQGQPQLYAVITADIKLTRLQHFMNALSISGESSSLLLSRNGTIMSARDPTQIMQNFADILAQTNGDQPPAGIQAALLAGDRKSQQIPCPNGPGDCVIRIGQLQPTGWPVAVLYSIDEVLEPLRRYQYKAAAIAGVTLLTLVLAVTIVTRLITGPLRQLAAAAHSIAAGDLRSPLPRIVRQDEIGQLIDAFSSMQDRLRQHIEELKQETAARSRLQGELAAARDIQMAMLPQGGEASWEHAGFSLWATVRPARSVGGDLYFYQAEGAHVFLAVGDVSDKGVAAALFMAKTISHIQQWANLRLPPDQGLARLNNALETGNDACMFVTLFLAVLDTQSGELIFASAGHTPPSLRRAERTTSLEQETGPALGLARDQVFPVNKLDLQTGERLAIYTDGIDEAFNGNREMFGTTRFNTLLDRLAATSLADAGRAMLQAVDDFAGEAPQADDITLLVLQREQQPSTLELLCDESMPASAHRWLESTLVRQELPADDIHDLLLITEEVLTNIAKYGGLDTSASVTLEVTAMDRSTVLLIEDAGKPFDPLQEAERADLGKESEYADIGGLGVHLITMLSDEQHYSRVVGQNRLQIVKHHN